MCHSRLSHGVSSASPIPPLQSVFSNGVVDNAKHGEHAVSRACGPAKMCLKSCSRQRSVVAGHPKKKRGVGAPHAGCSWSRTHQTSPIVKARGACCPPCHQPGLVAITQVCLDRCLQCITPRMLGSTAVCWVASLYRCHAYREDNNQTASVEHVVPLPARETHRPMPELERRTANPARQISPGVAQEGAGARLFPGAPRRRTGISSGW